MPNKGLIASLKEGDRFGQLTFIKEIGLVGKNRIGLFKCDCGETVEKWLINVVYSGTKSCGHKVDNKGNVRKKYIEERNPELFSWSDYDDIFQII